MHKHIIDKLRYMGACEAAINWAKTQPSMQAAWQNCERGDWMLWLLGERSGTPKSERRKKLVLAVCDCAETALKHVPKNEDRPKIAIETARRWAMGKVDLSEVRIAVGAAFKAANVGNHLESYYAAHAAAYGAAAAYDNGAAPAAATKAAYAVAYVAAIADTTGAATMQEEKKKHRRLLADIVRKHYSKPPRMYKKKWPFDN